MLDLSQRFEIGSGLAQGKTGATYAGRDRANGVDVVVKVLATPPGPLLNAILADLQRWVGYDHPNIGATLAAGQISGTPVAVFRRLPGEPLSDVISKVRLDPRVAVRIVHDVADALAQAHAQGLACGDLRSSRVLYDGQQARLTGLGLCRAHTAAPELTPLGIPFGHPDSLAPEVTIQYLASPTPATDTYALGILLYELLCGEKPFKGSPGQVLKLNRDAPLPPPPLDAGFSLAAASVTLRMTAKDPAARPPNGRAVAEAMKALFVATPQQQPGQAAPAAAPAPAAPRPRPSKVSGSWSVARIESAPPVGPLASLSVAVSGIMPAFKLPEEEEPSEQSGGEALVLGEKLGRGPAGRCFEATFGDRPVVVKALATALHQIPELRNRITERVVKARALDHPALSRVLKVIKTPKRTMIVSERAAGQPARQLLEEKGRLPYEKAFTIVRQLAEALEEAQAKGIAHGDIRPAKIYVDAKGKARLVDFGLCEASCLGGGFGSDGVPFGHPTYLAPEVLQERLTEPTPATDLYALGIVLYELLCGSPPFVGGSPRETLTLHLSQPMPTPKTVALPRPVTELIGHLTAKSPAQRLSSASELVAEVARRQAEVELCRSDTSVGDVEEFDPTATNVTGNQWESLVAEFRAPSDEDSRERRRSSSIASPVRPATSSAPAGAGFYLGAAAAVTIFLGLFLVGSSGSDAKARKVVAGTAAPSPRARPDPLTAPEAEPDAPTPAPAVRRSVELPQKRRWPAPPRPLKASARRVDPRLERHLREYEARVQDFVRMGKFAEAKALEETHLDQALLELDSEQAEARLTQLRRTVDESYRRWKSAQEDQLNQLLARRRYREAWRLAGRVPSWTLDGFLEASWKERVESELKGYTGKARALKGPDRDVKTLERWLSSKLAGWKKGTSRAYKNGALVQCYEDAGALSKDLALGPLEEGADLRLDTYQGDGVILIYKLPLARLLDVSLEVDITRVAPRGAQLALVAGLGGAKGPPGYGVSWDGSPVSLKGRVLRPLFEEEAPEPVQTGGRRLTVRMSAKGKLVTLVEGMDKRGTSRRSEARPQEGRLRGEGSIAIYARGVDVIIRSLHLRGQVSGSGKAGGGGGNR